MNVNLAQILATTAILVLDGVTIRPKAGVTFKPMRTSFPITSATVGHVQDRVNETGAEISFQPDGQLSEGILGVLHPYKALEIGDTLCSRVRLPVTSITLATDLLTFGSNHGLATGTPVKISYTGTAPTVTGGFPRNTTLYVRAVSGNTLTLHTSSAGASANNLKVDFTAQGTGSLILSRMRSLVLWTTLGIKVTFHNVEITSLPNLRIGAGQTMFETVTIRAFHKHGEIPQTDSLYTVEQATFSDTGFDPSDIVTGSPSLNWGSDALSDAPLGSLVEVDFALKTNDIESDVTRVAGMRFQGVDVTVKVTVPGLTWEETLTALGMTAERGGQIATDTLNVVVGSVFFALNCSLEPPDFMAAAEQHMVSALTFKSSRAQTDGIGAAWYSLYLD